MQSPIKIKKFNEAAVMDIEGIQSAILEHVVASPARLTPQHLEKTILETYSLDKTGAKAVLKGLVARGQLEYTYEFGSTYLVRSFNKPVRISAHVVIMPAGQSYRPAPDDVIVQIKPASPEELNQRCSVLDIGTGSGILAIAAVCLGIQKGLGIDIDPCAISEAGQNIAINNLENRIVISDRKIDSIDQVFMMVIANLRYPSLKNIYPQITKRTDTSGWVVLSGFRPHERAELMDLYTAKHFECIWTADELDWAAAVLKKIACIIKDACPF
jgi:ribosomal protein L11 methyltransferase